MNSAVFFADDCSDFVSLRYSFQFTTFIMYLLIYIYIYINRYIYTVLLSIYYEVSLKTAVRLSCKKEDFFGQGEPLTT